MAADFKNMPLYIYGYQDKFKALLGDASGAVAHVAAIAAGDSNSKIDGAWNGPVVADESAKFWEYVRLTGLAPGSTVIIGASATSGFSQRTPMAAE